MPSRDVTSGSNSCHKKCLKTGVQILIEPPYAYVLDNPFYHTHCAYCLTKGQLHKCLGCHVFEYCSKICQEKAWSEHKWECKNLRNLDIEDRSKIPSLVLLLSRIIYKIGKNNYGSLINSLVDDKLTFPPGRDFDQLASYKNERLDSAQDDFKMYTGFLNLLLPKQILREMESKLFDIYCKTTINVHLIEDVAISQVASAVYIKASYLNHRCLPNTNVNFNGPDMIVSLTEDVYINESDNFQDKIFISHIGPLFSYKTRQKLLNELFIECHCKLCTLHDTLDDYDWAAFPPELRFTGDPEDIEDFQMPMIKKLIDKWCSRYIDMDLMSVCKAFKHNPFPISNNILYNKCLTTTLYSKLAESSADYSVTSAGNASLNYSTMLMVYHIGLALRNGSVFDSHFPYYSDSRMAYLILLATAAHFFNDRSSAISYFNEAQNIYNTALSPKPLDGTVEFHDSCHVKCLRDSLHKLQKELFVL